MISLTYSVFIILFILAATIFIVGFLGIFLARKNLILILLCVELLLVSINIFFVIFSLYLDDLMGYIFSFLILTIAAAESAIGLAILIILYRLTQDIKVDSLYDIKA
jgi:NADH-quinone oxidoreductase subunit K